jgi:2-methylcitrate dehydratase
VDYPLGHPENPMSDHEIEEKFRLLAAGKLNRVRIKKVIDSVWRLDKLGDIGVLMPLLRIRDR